MNKLNTLTLVAALLLSLLMATSAAVAETDYLYKYNPEKSSLLGYNTNQLWAKSETESSSGSETAGADDSMDASKISTKELSQQSANPIGKFAYIFTQFATTFSDGDLNTSDDHIQGNITFQPIIPIPLYGSGDNEWRFVTRPTINLSIEQNTPKGEPDDFDQETELSDLLIPLPLALPNNIAGNWLLALGPSFSIPTATDDDFGKEMWCAGVSGVFGYIAKNWMLGFYPQTYFGIADADRDKDKEVAKFGNMFYWFFYNITDSFQVGTNPTIQWDARRGDGNRWNVPVGLCLAKITKWGNTPVRLEFAAEYSVIKEDDYGETARIKFNIIPVVPRPIMKAIFGGSK